MKKIFINLIPIPSLRRLLRKEYCNAKLIRYQKERELYNIGDHSYLGDDISIANREETSIGKYCSISWRVCLGLTQHDTQLLTTHPFVCTPYCPERFGDIRVSEQKLIDRSEWDRRPIKVGNDVWIGWGALVMDGLKIGDGAVIAAGAVVTKDVPPYAIIGGVPAKIIKYRFEKSIIDQLLELKWWDYPKEIITELPFDDVNKCIEMLSKNKQPSAIQ